jgi:1-acyl-sn-glycerol-3-phosphate acyltransferase
MGVGWRPYVAWYGDMDLMPHLRRLLSLGWITCEITFHPPVTAADFPDRKALAAHCERMTRDGFARLLAGRENP